jgi:hypothetical protein
MARPRPSALPQHVPFVLLRTVRLSETVYCHKIGFAGRRSLGQPRAGPVAADECRLFRSHLMLCQIWAYAAPARASRASDTTHIGLPRLPDRTGMNECWRKYTGGMRSRSTVIAGFGIEWFDQGAPLAPWQNLVHLGQECGTAGFLEVLCRNRKSQASVAAAPPVRCCSAAACLL